MRLQNKPQMVEAVMFFTDQKISKQMLYPEFEAVLDGMVNMPEFTDQQMQAVYVLINPRLLVRSLVFFYIDFDEKGAADPSWNIPLRHLAERAGRGPDLGAGPIRLACRSQSSVPWHQMHLWDPDLSPKHNHILMVRDAVKSNTLGVLSEDSYEPIIVTEQLTIAAEDRWESASQMDANVAQLEREKDQEQRHKAAQIIKQQRLRISTLETQHEEQLTKLRIKYQAELAAQQQMQLQLQQQLQQQERLNVELKQQLTQQAESLNALRADLQARLRAFEQHEREAVESLRVQFEHELQARIAVAVVEYKEQVAIRDVELAYKTEHEQQLLNELAQLKKQLQDQAGQSGEQILERLSRSGVVFVACHPGVGHITIPLQDMTLYQEKTMQYVAKKCAVTEDQYMRWLAHYEEPVCSIKFDEHTQCG
ncbi:MAG: chromosome partitioning protein ParA [Pseudomonas sp.]